MANKKDINIKIGIGCQSTVYAKTMASIGFNIINAKGKVTDILMRQSGDITSARTWIIQKAIEDGATHVLFVDHDMVFPPNALETLLSRGKDIIGVEYNKRKFPLEPVFKPLGETKIDEPYKADYVGTGLMLIDLSIIPKMTKPWFLMGRDSNGQVVVGEDAWFCKTARDCGFDTWIDPTVKTGHLGDYQY
jgi:hypothetical protein